MVCTVRGTKSERGTELKSLLTPTARTLPLERTHRDRSFLLLPSSLSLSSPSLRFARSVVVLVVVIVTDDAQELRTRKINSQAGTRGDIERGKER